MEIIKELLYAFLYGSAAGIFVLIILGYHKLKNYFKIKFQNGEVKKDD